MQWHTQVQHALELPLLYVYGLFAMAERPFDKLSTEHQAVVAQELRAAVKSADESARRDHLSALSALGKQGIAWQQPSDIERQEWLTLAAEARQRLIADGYVSEDLYKQAVALLEEYRTTGG